MAHSVVRQILLFVLATTVVGCSFGPWGGPAYTLDPSKFWTSEQAIVPRNDGFFENGTAMDQRRQR